MKKITNALKILGLLWYSFNTGIKVKMLNIVSNLYIDTRLRDYAVRLLADSILNDVKYQIDNIKITIKENRQVTEGE